MPFKKKNQTAVTVLAAFMVVVMLVFTGRAYQLQLNSTEFSDRDDGAASVLNSVLKAPRGEILDCYGRQIAVNRDGYNIVFNKAYVKDNLNDVILKLANLLDEKGTPRVDELPITPNEPYEFTEDGDTARLIKKLQLAHYATPQNCIDAMVEKYGLEKYSGSDLRKIMGVRYSMDIADFSISYPFTFAEDIPEDLMLKISESSFLLSGVTVDTVPFRQYVDTSLAVNLIGTVGPIFKEDWEEYSKKGYSYNDKVGKSGIEAWGEEYLRGTDGIMTYRLDEQGNIISKEVTKEPIAGKTIMLTLDKTMQRIAQDSLATTVKELQAKGGTARAGEAVVFNINTGNVLCAANYPTYDSATLGEDYNSLAVNSDKPLTNRAFQGVYPIGSTIKPIVALSAMENNQYTHDEHIYCRHTYTLFSDYQPSCMGYHKSINLKTALSKSCNYFFFELGRRVGAMQLTDYFKQFGLGLKTGVEVDDAAGILLEPKSNGAGGDTLQISIGQLNAFTPLQLANYTATLANGGTHYKAGIVDKIVSYDMSETYEEFGTEVVNTVEMKKANLDDIKEGMLSVTVDGTGQATLGNYPIRVGGKTGTAQVTDKADHSIFIAFAPFDNPEIAISVVLEHGASGYAAGTVVKNILDSYFFTDSGSKGESMPFTVLQ